MLVSFDFEASQNEVSGAQRLGNVTGLCGEMRVEAIRWLPQKMSDHRVAHIFRFARAFTAKPQRIAQSLCGGQAAN